MIGGSRPEGPEENAEGWSRSIDPSAAEDASEMILAEMLSTGAQPLGGQDAWLRHRRLEILIAAELRRSDTTIVERVRTLTERTKSAHGRQMASRIRQRLSRRRPVLRRVFWKVLLIMVVGLTWWGAYGDSPMAYTADGAALRPGTEIAPGSEVRFSDGTTLTAGQGSNVTVVTDPSGGKNQVKKVRLTRGSLTIENVQQSERQLLKISTPQGNVTVVNAACVLSSDPLGTRVSVSRGLINFMSQSTVDASLVVKARQVGAINGDGISEQAARIILHVDATGHSSLFAGQVDRTPDGIPALRGQLYHQPTGSVGLYLASGNRAHLAPPAAHEVEQSHELFRWTPSLHFRIRGYSLAARIAYLWCGSNGQGWLREITLPGGWFAIDCDASGFVDDLQRQPASPQPGQLITEMSIALSPVDEMYFTTFDVVDHP